MDTVPSGSSAARRILILVADTGFGHRSAAAAIAAALEELYGDRCVTRIVNPLDDPRAPSLLRTTQADYDKSVRAIPDLYKFGYQATDAPLPSAVIERALTVMLFEVLRDLVRREQPDVIVAVHQNYLAPLGAVAAVEGRHVPLVTVCTDLATVHRVWFSDATDLCLVPTQAVYDLAVGYGLAPEQVAITGIPVHPAFAKEARGRAELRAALGWRRDLTTVLAVGSKRVSHLTEALHVLNHSGLPLQLAVVAGGDEETYEELRAVRWHAVAHVYDFVEDMPALMRAADCIVSKAGGLIVSEALACGLPLLLIDVIEGQETGNAEFVVAGGAGDLARDPSAVLEAMCHWLEQDRALLAERAAHARALGHARAAYEVAERVWAAAEPGALPRAERATGALPALIELLERFNIPWQSALPRSQN